MTDRIKQIKEKVDRLRDDRRLSTVMAHYARLGEGILDRKGYLTASDAFLVNLLLVVARDEGIPFAPLMAMRQRAVKADAFSMAGYVCRGCVPTATEECPGAGRCDHCGAQLTHERMIYKVPRTKAKL